MASSNLELERPGGRVNVDTGQLLSESDIDRIGSMALQSLLAVLSLLFFDDEAGVPLSGFPREELDTDHCVVSATGDLSYSVSTGWGFRFDSAATVQEFGQNRFSAIVRSQPATGSLGAHHATLPRIDLVCIAPAVILDQSASRNVKNPSTGLVSSASVDQRQRLTSDVLVVAGTPNASPTVPATPAGYVALAEAAVPATSGAAVWSDVRPVLELGHYFKGLPRYATGNYVPLGEADELRVTAASPAAMAVLIGAGRAVINGISRFYKAQRVAVTASHATLVRRDRVVARQNGTITVEAGTAGSGIFPVEPANSTTLALIVIAATVTTIVSADITDRRHREPFVGSTHLQVRSTSHDRLNKQTVKTVLVANAPVGDVATLDVLVTYPDGLPLVSTTDPAGAGAAVRMMAEYFLYHDLNTTAGMFGLAGVTAWRQMWQPEGDTDDGDNTIAFSADGTNATPVLTSGSAILQSPRMLFEITDPNDPATIFFRRVANTTTGTYLIHVYPVDTPGSGAWAEVTFA